MSRFGIEGLGGMAAVTKHSVLRRLVDEQGGRCHWCRVEFPRGKPRQIARHPRRPTLDHIITVVDHGGDDTANLVAACELCNHLRGWLPVEIWLLRIERGQTA